MIEEITTTFCPHCDADLDGYDLARLYECGDCGNFADADGEGNRCPQCNKFASRVGDACPECEEQIEDELEEVTRWQSSDGQLHETEAEAVEWDDPEAIAERANEKARRARKQREDFDRRDREREQEWIDIVAGVHERLDPIDAAPGTPFADMVAATIEQADDKIRREYHLSLNVSLWSPAGAQIYQEYFDKILDMDARIGEGEKAKALVAALPEKWRGMDPSPGSGHPRRVDVVAEFLRDVWDSGAWS